MSQVKSIKHYLADRRMSKEMYNKHDQTHLAVKDSMERRAELVEGIQLAEQGLKKINMPSFRDQLYLAIPSFRFGVSVDLVKSELERQLNEARSELEKIDHKLSLISEILKMEE